MCLDNFDSLKVTEWPPFWKELAANSVNHTFFFALYLLVILVVYNFVSAI